MLRQTAKVWKPICRKVAVTSQTDPYKYLIYLLEHLPNETFQRQSEILQKYLPWSPEVLSNCK